MTRRKGLPFYRSRHYSILARHNFGSHNNMVQKYVHLIGVVQPKPQHAKLKVLLCKWHTGCFANRYTGLWGEVLPIDKSLRAAVLRLAGRFGYAYPQIREGALKLMAVFDFDVPVENKEYIYVMDLDSEFVFCDGLANSELEWTPEWYDMDALPFSQMPADDILWYEKVLKGTKLEGYFVFAGEPKFTIKSFELKEVNELDEPTLETTDTNHRCSFRDS